MGLALGLASVLLILVFVADEFSYDRFHKGSDKLYRIVSSIQTGTDVLHTAFSPNALRVELKDNFGEVEFCSRVSMREHTLVSNNLRIDAKGVLADSDFLKMFSFEVAAGSDDAALTDPSSLVVTKDLASRLFGAEDAVNKIVVVGDEIRKITAIINDVPRHAHLQFEYIIPFPLATKENSTWDNFGQYHYVKFLNGSDARATQAKLQKIIDTNFSVDPNLKGVSALLTFQPVTDIHLGEVSYQMDQPGKGNKQYVIIFIVLAIFILVIACINFTNLGTARAIKRLKEIGVRKAIGANRGQLVIQLLGESLAAATISMVVALLMAWVGLEAFSHMVGRSIVLNYDGFAIPVMVCFGAMLVAGIFSGLYPALVLSSYKPTSLVNGTLHKRPAGGYLSKTLVVVQFGFSILIIAGMFVVYAQLHYIRDKDLGFERENILNVHGYSANYEAFKSELLKYPDIKAMSATDYNPLDIFLADLMDWSGKSSKAPVLAHNLSADYDYIETMKMQIIDGRDFSQAVAGDNRTFIINEAAARIINNESPVGLKLNGNGSGYWPIIGVVKDFHFRSIHEKVGPIRISIGDRSNILHYTLIRFEGDADLNLDLIAKTWSKFNPEKTFEFTFMDDDFESMYRTEVVMEQLFRCFAGLAIVVACMGLFGLSAYTASVRNKEYSIRKVFGASASSLFYTSSIDHLILVGIASIISVPIGYYACSIWLGTFAYHAELTVYPFVIAGIAGMVLALLTVSYQSFKVIVTKPSTILRAE